MTDKRCSSCRETKPRAAFSPDGRRLDGLYSACRQCRAATQRATRGQLDLRERQGHHFKARYGITTEDYERMHRDQDGKCAVCGVTPEHQLHVDHDHKSGKVRGLLCTMCNRGLGCFYDNTDSLLGAMAYLIQQRDVLSEVTP